MGVSSTGCAQKWKSYAQVVHSFFPVLGLSGLMYKSSGHYAHLLLARSADPKIRGTVAANPGCPAEVLLVLLDDPDDHVSDLAFLNPSLPPEAREEIWENVVRREGFGSRRGLQLRRIMFSPTAPLDLMEHILSHDLGDLDDLWTLWPESLTLGTFVGRLLESAHCPEPAVRRAINDGPPGMREWAAGNSALTPELIETLIMNGDNLDRLILNPAASHRIRDIVPLLTTKQLLDVPRSLKDHDSEAVILCVRRLSGWFSQNPEPDADVPYSDGYVYPSVVVRVLAEYSTSPEEVSRLCCHENPFVRRLAGRNPIATAGDRVMIALMANR